MKVVETSKEFDEKFMEGTETVLGQAHSPIPLKVRDVEMKNPNTLNFYEALHEIMDDKQVTKLEWGNKEYYGFMDTKGILTLHKPDGRSYNWVLNDGDISGTDYVIR